MPVPAFTLRPAQEEDVPFLLRLRELAMDPHHRAAGIVQTPAEMVQRVRNFFDEAQVVEVGGAPVGLWKLHREPAQWWVIQVQLMPAFQGLGIGASLVRGLLDEAHAAGVPVKLKVLKSNPARRLYERLGFVIAADEGHGDEMVWRGQPRAR
ncbi:MAG TPA: GNAT family N-acetyltransferase [Albitalea sp.]|nr:GNAT family N-acetyltransferase [Albitalea sp.]